MPLTPLQKEVLALLAAQRSEESHFAGGVVLNATDGADKFQPPPTSPTDCSKRRASCWIIRARRCLTT